MSTDYDVVTRWDMWVTFVCSALSLLGSAAVIVSYMVTKSTANPRAAQLICNLAMTDFVWFLSAFVQTLFWVSGNHVPSTLCYAASPLVLFCRLASLMWTCAISIDVLMSVKVRKWTRKGPAGEEQSRFFKRIYFAMVLLFALPNTVVNIVLQHSTADNSDLGCNPGYEKIGNAVLILLTEVLPIAIGFTLNLAIFCYIFRTMSKKAYPQSVRKRRRRVMYHYIIVCIVSWTPTILFYSCEICGVHSAILEVVARGSLYLTGFSNFLVFGMQDPHLSRSFAVIFFLLGCGSCCLDDAGMGRREGEGMKAHLRVKDEQKSVMFTGHVESNADISKDKKNIYKYHKLSVEDKILLYEERPDLNPKLSIGAQDRRRRSSGSSTAHRDNNGFYADPGPPPAVLSTAGATPRAKRVGDSGLAAQSPESTRDPGVSNPQLPSTSSATNSSYSGTVQSPLKEPLLPRANDVLDLPQAQGHGEGRDGHDERGSATRAGGEVASSEIDEVKGSLETKRSDSYDEEKGESADRELGRAGEAIVDDGSNTPATVSIDSQPPPDLEAAANDSSSDEGDEEDEGLEVPLSSTMTSIPRQITRSLSGEGMNSGSFGFDRSP